MRKSFWVICVDNHEYLASLERGKVYRAFADADADGEEMVRIVDESGEDYLSPLQYFERIALPDRVQRELRRPVALYRRPTRNSAALRK